MHGLLYKMAESEDKTGVKPDVKVYVYATRNSKDELLHSQYGKAAISWQLFIWKELEKCLFVLLSCMNCLVFSWFSHLFCPVSACITSFISTFYLWQWGLYFVRGTSVDVERQSSEDAQVQSWSKVVSSLEEDVITLGSRNDVVILFEQVLQLQKNPRYENVRLICYFCYYRSLEIVICVYILIFDGAFILHVRLWLAFSCYFLFS